MTNFIHAKKNVLITPTVFESMLMLSDDPWVRSLLVYLYLFGVRIIEAVTTHQEDLTIEAFDGVEYLIANSPTAKNLKTDRRLIYMPLDTDHLDILLGYLESRGSPLRRYSKGRLWPYSRGWAWKKITDLNKEISPHVFRHNRLTRFAQGEATAFQIKDFAGHSDLRPATSYIESSGVLTLKMVQRIKVT